ncbi:MAG: hypothetical protein ACOCUI_01255 [bacterium]
MKKITHENIEIDSVVIKEAEATYHSSFKKYKSDEELFYDMCFCILAPQAKFHGNLYIVNELKRNNFYYKDISMKKLIKLCERSRFKHVKSKRLILAKEKFPKLIKIIRNNMIDTQEKREWLVKNINGYGMKASSHFLRNCGSDKIAILDTHIFKFLKADSPKTKKEYLELENKFIKIAKQMQLNPNILDLIIWKHYAKVDWNEYVY